jgi:hypothetical protein
MAIKLVNGKLVNDVGDELNCAELRSLWEMAKFAAGHAVGMNPERQLDDKACNRYYEAEAKLLETGRYDEAEVNRLASMHAKEARLTVGDYVRMVLDRFVWFQFLLCIQEWAKVQYKNLEHRYGHYYG